MNVHLAQLAGGTSCDDRIYITETAVVLLDGATAFAPVDIDPGTYAATVGTAIAEQLDADASIPDAVATAIKHAVSTLDLRPGASPSSTVTVLRARDDVADLYVLGDSPIYYGSDETATCMLDTRIAALAIPETATYTERLRNGHGYDDQHRTTLTALQQTQRGHLNVEGGYWIAETNPDAAYHGITTTLGPDRLRWAVLATDGASDLIDHRQQPQWSAIAQYDSAQLAAVLADIHRWEEGADPDGRDLPRAKRHDDKTIAAIPAVW